MLDVATRNALVIWGRYSLAPNAQDADPASTALARQAGLRFRALAESNPHSTRALGRRFKLDEAETQAIELLVAANIDESVARRSDLRGSAIARALDDGSNRPRIDLFSASGALCRFALVERTDGGGADLHTSRHTWTVPTRILRWLDGCETADAETLRLSYRTRPIQDLSALALGEHSVANAREAMGSKQSVVIASGTPGLGRRSLLAAMSKEANFEILEVDAKRLAKEPAALAKQLRTIARECKLLAKAPLIRNIDALVDDKDVSRVELVGTELVAELDTNIFVTCGVNRPPMRWDRPVIVIELKPPSSAQRAELWKQLLSDASDSDADYLATQYPLAPALMHAAAAAALARAVDRKVTPKDIEAGIRAVLDDKLGNFAKRVEVTQGWDDLVIDSEQGQAITELIARIRQRRTVYEQWGFAAKVGKGLGVSALFSGPPGTGKTMVAALIAKELGLELYQVDMGKLVSKYIGETEKQLGELFDAAEAGHAILLFDEADSMFGKRTEVKSSNDRYANLETNYLLQRLESFTGICLLTSNHESNIDPAFQRRLSLHLRFQVPDEDEREKLWRAMLPAAAPVEPNIDFLGLAHRFEMTGGYIRNAALRAAFLAADAGTSIGDAQLEHAARIEYEGMGKIVAPRAQGWPSRLSSSL
jgi:SpoVK/Ycf46/Vps4 family AAA+-type ATPase